MDGERHLEKIGKSKTTGTGQKCMLPLVKSVETRLAGAKGSHAGSKGRSGGQTIGGFE